MLPFRMEYRPSKFLTTRRTYRLSTTVYQSYFTSGPIPAYAPVEGTSNSTGDQTRSGLPGGGRWKQPRPLRNVAGNLRRRSLDRFLERALAQRIFECPDTARTGNIRCRGTSGGAAACQCRRGNRDRHTQLTQRYDSASHPIHAQPYVELLGLACHANGGRGELYGYGRRFHSRGIGDFAIFSSRKLHHVRSRWRDLSAEGFGGDSLLRLHKSASGHYHHRIPKLWNHPGRQWRQRGADRHARRSLER